MYPNAHRCLLFATIVVIVVLILATVGKKLYKHYRSCVQQDVDHLLVNDPAIPLVRDAVAALRSSINNFVSAGKQATAAGGEINGLGLIVKFIEKTGERIDGLPPTYANYLSLYRGVSGSDAVFLSTARAFEQRGNNFQQKIANGSAPEGQSADDAAVIGNQFLIMGMCLRKIIKHIHVLGSALDVE